MPTERHWYSGRRPSEGRAAQLTYEEERLTSTTQNSSTTQPAPGGGAYPEDDLEFLEQAQYEEQIAVQRRITDTGR